VRTGRVEACVLAEVELRKQEKNSEEQGGGYRFTGILWHTVEKNELRKEVSVGQES